MGEVVGAYTLVLLVGAVLLAAASMLHARVRQRRIGVRRTRERR